MCHGVAHAGEERLQLVLLGADALGEHELSEGRGDAVGWRGGCG